MLLTRSILRTLALALVAAACTSAQTTSTTESPPTTLVSATSSSSTTTQAPPTTLEVTLPTVVPAEPEPDPPAPPPDLPSGVTGVAVAAVGGAEVAESLGGEPFVRAHQGLVFPVVGRAGHWLQVETQCETRAWINGDQVAFTPGAREINSTGAGFDFRTAVVVLDPGHGGPNTGAVGPAGTVEKDLNLDIARRTRDLLGTSHAVDWETGAILTGSSVPPVGTVWMTRTEGPPGADIETGLVFRATLANAAGAHALVSIHNNTSPDTQSEITGAEAYYRVMDSESKRLGGLIVEELRRGFGSFNVEWATALDAGAKYRVRSDGVTDLYGVLKDAQVPAVLVEGAYLSNPAEEQLLQTPEFRQAYADAIYRALVRFLSTDDPGSGFVEPINRTASPGSGSPQPKCTIPAQP